MSERLHRLVMKSFRGVPGELPIEFGSGQSMAVFGDNGTGKSTIADALEWYFTGQIELLSHEGRQQAIRNMNNGSAATVVEVTTDGSLGGTITTEQAPAAGVCELSRKETFLLRGRTLADFINKTKSEKWKALAEILGLEEIDALRQDLQRAHNDLRKDAKDAAEEFQACSESLGVSANEPAEDALLTKIREACEAAGVAPPPSLQEVRDETWQPSASISGKQSSRAAGLRALEAEFDGLPAPKLDLSAVQQWNDMLSSDQAADVSRLRLLQEAEVFLRESPDTPSCPLCGQSVSEEELVKQVRDAVTGFREASEKLESRRNEVQQVIDELSQLESRRQTLRDRASGLELSFPSLPSSPRDTLRACLQERKPVDLKALRDFQEGISQWDTAAREVCAVAVPPASEADRDAILKLVSLCEKTKTWMRAKDDAARLEKARGFAERILKAYQGRQTAYVSTILEQISGRVAEIYGKLHPGEGLTGVAVETWTAKGIELAIDFYGTRHRPPHGVLSESHLNSLAIALFLAMAETFNQKLGFLVLDDVVNSFDLEHRGQLAELLAKEFSDWQLIVLTHDHLFFEQLVRRAPDWKKLEFTSWSHEEGPRTTRYETGGMLAKAQRCLDDGDLTGAATKARRALEELLQEVCQGIEAPLPFRRGAANDRREIGELFTGLRRGLDKYAKKMLGELKPLLADLEADVQAALNVEAHASRGKAATGEVRVALERIGQLDAVWSCPACQTRIWLIGTPQSAMCRCGKSRYPPVPVAEAQSAKG